MSTEEAMENIKTVLLGLKATGNQGFEGFLRIVLTELMGIPSRLDCLTLTSFGSCRRGCRRFLDRFPDCAL